MAPELETDRLLLRDWKMSDLDPFAHMRRDKEVMEFFPETLTRVESDAVAGLIMREFQEKKYGLYAVEVKGGAPFIGFVGLHSQTFPASFTPCVEIGWRIAKEHWGNGYATEATLEVLKYGKTFLDTIYSFTSVLNKRSIHIMEKLGMQKELFFEHPNRIIGSPLRPHVLYSIRSSSI